MTARRSDPLPELLWFAWLFFLLFLLLVLNSVPSFAPKRERPRDTWPNSNTYTLQDREEGR